MNNKNPQRAQAEAALEGAGVAGPFGLMKFSGARNGQGLSADGLCFRLEEFDTDASGRILAVVASLSQGNTVRLPVGRFARVGDAALYIDTRPFWSDRIDILAVAPIAVKLLRLVTPSETERSHAEPASARVTQMEPAMPGCR